MLIAIDGNEANVKERVGVSVYTYKLLDYFQKQANENVRFIVFIKNPRLFDLPKESKFFKYEFIPGKFLWSQLFLPLRLLKRRILGEKIDVFFSPAHYSPRFPIENLIVTIHDLAFLYYPNEFLQKDLYKLKNWTANSVKKAKKIIAVSKTTKKDLMKFYDLDEQKIEVIYNGFEKTHIKEEIIDIPIEHKKYLLYVGTIQPRKNINILINAFNQFKKKYPDFKLVITGKKGWLYDDIYDEVERLGINNDVILTGYIKENQLVYLYKNAFCFILPSLYEGFGIPILEAMSFNCPVISSFNASLPEIGADACLYFDPNNISDLLEKMKMIKENNSLKQELIKKGKERIKLFSWNSCAERTLELIKSII